MEIRPEVFSNFNISPTYSNWTFLSALSFTNQSWIGTSIFSNPPYWSLGYEILFYAFFSIICYFKGIKRFILSALLLLLMGPSIILYLPIWLLGVYCYKNLSLLSHLKTWQSSLIFILSLIGISILCLKNTTELVNNLAPTMLGDSLFSMLLHPAQYFLVDYLIAICVACNILSYSYIVGGIKEFINQYEKTIRFLAGYTFSAYLYHFPILCLYSIFFPFEEFPITSILAALIATPLTIGLLGHYTEKHKKPYRAALVKFFKVRN
jgi:peptidoglycan/LPS O-acetylase OafA/YrhL